MPWAVCVKTKDGKTKMLGEEEIGEEFGPDIHIVPCVYKAGSYDFGWHEFIRECACCPRIQLQDGKVLVIHTDRVN